MYHLLTLASRCWNKSVSLQTPTLFNINSRKYLSVPKDIVIYSRNQPHGIIRIIGICALGQWFAVGYMSTVMYQNMPAFFHWIPTQQPLSTSSDQRLPLADWKYRLGFSLFSFGAASVMMTTMVIYCFRYFKQLSDFAHTFIHWKWTSSVKGAPFALIILAMTFALSLQCKRSFSCIHVLTTSIFDTSVSAITLLKASDQVMIRTYTPLGTFRNFVVSVRNVSALQPRLGNMSQIPLKVKDHKFNYMVEKSGDFPHPSLFDRTVGIKRDFGIEKKS